MAAISGKDGNLTIAGLSSGASVIHLRSWTVNDLGPASIDVTAFANTWHARTVGINDWSFTAEGILDSGTNVAVLTAAASCVFTSATGRTLTGNAVCRVSPNVVIDGEATVSVSGDGAGAVSIA